MDYMSLSDEELLKAVQAARKISSEKGIELNVAIQNAMEVILDEKKKIEESNVQVEVPTVDQPSIVEPTQSNEVAINFDTADFIRNNYEGSFDLARKVNGIVKEQGGMDTVNLYDHLMRAQRGELSPEYFKKNPNIFMKLNQPYRSEFIESINNINSMMRENYYSYYATISNDEIEKARAATIDAYKKLKENGVQARQYLDSNNKWNHEAATVTIKDNISRFDAGDSVAHRVGITSFNSTENLEEGKISYSPQSFDNVYLVTQAHLTSQGDFHNQRMFNEAEAVVDQMIANLEKMSVEDFRKYKLNQMKLTKEEQTIFEQHMNEYMSSKENEVGRSL